MGIKWIDLPSDPWQDEIQEAVRQVLDSGSYIADYENPESPVAALAAALAGYTDSPFCVPCSSGTGALLAALLALGVGPGVDVIMPSYTFIAGYNAARILGARVLFADIHKGTWTMDPKSVVEIITQRTAVLMPTSLFGQPADMDEYRSLAAGFGCAVLEDAAQSLGAKYKGRKSGNLSQVAVTSFFPTKTLGGYGEGGAVFTDHPAIAARVQAIVQNGLADGTHWHLGLNLRMSNLQAAIVNVKLKYLDYMIHRRRRIARIYGEKLTGTGIGIPYGVDEHAWAVYTIVVPNVLSLERHLREQGIPTKRYYSPPIHMLPVTEGNPQRYTLPVTTNIAAESISLPCSHTTTDEEAEIVAEEVLKWWQS